MEDSLTGVVKEKAEFQIFGQVDLNKKGQVISQYPSWYFDQQKDDLKEEISRIETDLKFDRIPKTEVQITNDRLQQKKEKLKELEKACVELKGKQKDKVAGVRDELGQKIGDALFSRSDMKKGLADAREEMKRMTEPTIPVSGDMLKFCQACNVKVVKGKVTRDGAAKAWKIASKALGEPSNVEHLRKD